MKYINLTGDVLVSAAVMAYLGPFTATFRNGQLGGWVALCKAKDIPCSASPTLSGKMKKAGIPLFCSFAYLLAEMFEFSDMYCYAAMIVFFVHKQRSQPTVCGVLGKDNDDTLCLPRYALLYAVRFQPHNTVTSTAWHHAAIVDLCVLL